ncbi:DUF2793 domain-containing protein [Devosia sp.]|uniref:DUF2793 domain-containing protein n=1 Tax=Devosia sp. TaxID=1871048 RepID=UPI003A8F3611
MTTSPNLGLPFIVPAQAGKHITHNEAIVALDTLTQLAVIDRDLTAPPTEPTPGDRYIVAAPAVGDWSGHEMDIAAWDGSAWQFFGPAEGWLAWVVDEAGLIAWDGSGWAVTAGLGGVLPLLGINAAPDATNRLALKSDAMLLSHDDVTPGTGGVHLKLNKAAPGDTAALLFQTGFSGRAELGTAGDDKLHLKLSADGAVWSEAWVIDASGKVGIGTAAPAVTMDVAGPIRCASYTLATLPAASAGAGQIILVADEAGGPVLAFSDGTNWRRVTDRAVVS